MVKILGIGDLLATALLLATAFNLDIPVDMLIFISASPNNFIFRCSFNKSKGNNEFVRSLNSVDPY